MHEKPRDPQVDGKDKHNGGSDDDDIPESKEEKALSDEEQSRRAPLPLAHRGTLCFYRVVTTLLLMMWIYLTPDTTSAFSCLIGSSEESSCMSLLRELTLQFCSTLEKISRCYFDTVSCQGTTCSGWFHTHCGCLIVEIQRSLNIDMESQLLYFRT